MKGLAAFASIALLAAMAAGAESRRPVINDFNGDGASDLAVYESSTGKWFIRTLTGDVLVWDLKGGYAGAKPVPADYDGDGRCDLAIYDPVAFVWYVRTLDGHALAWKKKAGFAGAIPVPADYDGDGKADLAVYNPNTGDWYVLSLDDRVIHWKRNWGFKGDERPWEQPRTLTVLPMPYDYDRDQKADLAIYYRGYSMTDSGWYILGSTGSTWVPSIWGSSGSIPAPGMYRSVVDEKTYPAGPTVYKVTTGEFNTPYMFQFALGTYGTTLPVSGHDFDGNGWDDHAVYDYTTGVWRISFNDADGNADPGGSHYEQPPRTNINWGFAGAVPADIYSTIYSMCRYSTKPW